MAGYSERQMKQWAELMRNCSSEWAQASLYAENDPRGEKHFKTYLKLSKKVSRIPSDAQMMISRNPREFE